MELLDEVARFSPALEVCGSEIKRDLMNALARSQAPHQPQLGTCVAEIVWAQYLMTSSPPQSVSTAKGKTWGKIAARIPEETRC